MFIPLRIDVILFFVIFSLGILGRRTFGKTDYCDISSCPKGLHTMCLYSNANPSSQCNRYDNKTGFLTANDVSAIVKKHNEWREKVAKGLENLGNPGPQPPASNMQIMKWDSELALIAQRYVDQCTSGHDRCRNVDRFIVGQNIATHWSTGTLNSEPEYLMQGWYDEVKRFDKNNVDKYSFDPFIGHYSQLVWAKTSYVGCGRAIFWDTKFGMNSVRLVCNYGPAGNYINESVYKIGKAGQTCQSGVSKTNNALCD